MTVSNNSTEAKGARSCIVINKREDFLDVVKYHTFVKYHPLYKVLITSLLTNFCFILSVLCLLWHVAV